MLQILITNEVATEFPDEYDQIIYIFSTLVSASVGLPTINDTMDQFFPQTDFELKLKQVKVSQDRAQPATNTLIHGVGLPSISRDISDNLSQYSSNRYAGARKSAKVDELEMSPFDSLVAIESLRIWRTSIQGILLSLAKHRWDPIAASEMFTVEFCWSIIHFVDSNLNAIRAFRKTPNINNLLATLRMTVKNYDFAQLYCSLHTLVEYPDQY